MKSPPFGQVFVFRTKLGVPRGSDCHHPKTEKLLVVEDAIICSCSIRSRGDPVGYRVSGLDYSAVEIPPGHAHSIGNLGRTGLVKLFWSSKIFDPGRADTQILNVLSRS